MNQPNRSYPECVADCPLLHEIGRQLDRTLPALLFHAEQLQKASRRNGGGEQLRQQVNDIQAAAEDAIRINRLLRRSVARHGRLRVLVIDDDPLIRQLMADILADGGQEYRLAGTAEDALAIFAEEDFDLVITDRSLPRMNGEELAARIKSVNPDLPIIMCTGEAESLRQAGDGTPAGIDCLLGKPVRLARIRAVLTQFGACLEPFEDPVQRPAVRPWPTEAKHPQDAT